VYYMLVNAPAFRGFLGLPPEHALWLGIQPMSAAVFGVPVGFAVAILVSLACNVARAPRRAPT
jgi:cation/acetate symporter